MPLSNPTPTQSSATTSAFDQTHARTPARAPAYRMKSLADAMKKHRAACKPSPEASQTLAEVETLIRYALRIPEMWDDTHDRRAENLLALGLYDAASSAATLLFEESRRDYLYTQVQAMRPPIGDDAAGRVAESLALGREVLQ